MEYVIEPFEGVSELKFGMTMEETHALLGAPVNVFRRTSVAPGPTETYADFFLNYDAAGTLESVEFFGRPKALLRGVSLMSTPCDRLRELLGEVEEDGAGFTAPGCGVGVYAPDEEYEPDCLPESVIVLRRDLLG